MVQTAVPVQSTLVEPMDPVAEGVYGLRIGFVNVFGLTHANGSWTLVDAGVPYSAGFIGKWAERVFGSPPNAIVLTHGHFDHVGGAPYLAEAWQAPVYAHRLEEPYLDGSHEYPPPKTAEGGLMSLLDPIYPRGPADIGPWLRLLAESANVIQTSALPEWQIVHTPGHTAGHISLFRAADHTLLAGDALCTTRPESFFASTPGESQELHGPPACFTEDYVAAADSIRRLALLHPRVIAPGHGKPLTGPEAEKKLGQLSRHFIREVLRRDRREAA